MPSVAYETRTREYNFLQFASINNPSKALKATSELCHGLCQHRPPAFPHLCGKRLVYMVGWAPSSQKKSNIGALIIRIGLAGYIYDNFIKEPLKPYSNY